MQARDSGSIVAPFYESGKYFTTHADPDQDSPFKAKEFLKAWEQVEGIRSISIRSYADVGCGGGGAAALVAEGLRERGNPLLDVAGYDISPHVLSLKQDAVKFHFEDFCKADAFYDLVTLFDVVEHVPDPIAMLRQVAERCNFIGLHIPLDRSIANCFFDRFQRRLRYPGHLVVLDAPMALNLLAMSGVLTLGYRYTHGYRAPSGTMTPLQRSLYPFRALLASVSPWLSSCVVGGVSLMAVVATPAGMRKLEY